MVKNVQNCTVKLILGIFLWAGALATPSLAQPTDPPTDAPKSNQASNKTINQEMRSAPLPMDYTPFIFQDSQIRIPDSPAGADQGDSELFGEKIQYSKDFDRLKEIQDVTPEGETRTYFFPRTIGKYISEHSVSMGPGYTNNTQSTTLGAPSWVLGVESKHLILPRFGPFDTFKWGLVLGSRMHFVERAEDLQLQLRAKSPIEIRLSELFQIRALGILDVMRKPRWDFESTLPFLESQTTYLHFTPQVYLQYRPAPWVELRLGAPIFVRLPFSKARNFYGQEAATSAGFFEAGPGLYANFPIDKDLRFKLGGAYLKRTFSENPLITQVPLAGSSTLSQNHIQILGLMDYQTTPDLNIALRAHYHNFSSDIAEYDNSVIEGSLAFEWKLDTLWLIPSVGYWRRSFPSLFYPVDPTTPGQFTAFSTDQKLESLLSVAFRTVYEFEFQNFESLYISLAISIQNLTNSYGGTDASSFEALAKTSVVDVLFGFGFFL